jgi:hypothetical protein
LKYALEMVAADYNPNRPAMIFTRFEAHQRNLQRKAERLVDEFLAGQVYEVKTTTIGENGTEITTKKVVDFKALVAALRLSSDIDERIIEKAMDLGIVPRIAQRHELTGDLNLNHTTRTPDEVVEDMMALTVGTPGAAAGLNRITGGN